LIEEFKDKLINPDEYIKKEVFEELLNEHKKLFDLVNSTIIKSEKRKVNLNKLDSLVDEMLKNKLKEK
jgi:hemerythrin